MFFKSTFLKRKAYRLLTMHKTIREEFKKQLDVVITPEKLATDQEAEISLFIGFTILKAIETATPNKQEFTELSNQFLDFLLNNEDNYGLDFNLKEFFIKGMIEGRFGEYESYSLEEIPKYFIKKVWLNEQSLKNKDIKEIVDTNFLLAFTEGKKIIENKN